MKALLFRAALVVAAMQVAGRAEAISVPVVTQDANRLVTVTYSLDADAIVTMEVLTNSTVLVDASNYWNVEGDVNRLVKAGDRTITWQPDVAWPSADLAAGFKVKLTAWPANKPPLYMVVNLAGPNTRDIRYYASSNAIPGGILASPVYRDKRMALRRIDAKDVSWTMGYSNADYGGTASVTMTNDYYLGVFEVTQGQWYNVASNAVLVSQGFTGTFWAQRPKEFVSMANVRQAANNVADTAYDYPHAPHPDSFLGKLRDRTGLDFDLPSEAQWEFGGRAGCSIIVWNTGRGENTDATFPGRSRVNGGFNQVTNEQGVITYVDNVTQEQANMTTDRGTAIVGTYEPSVWGLYDIHGNLEELCLDKYVDLHSSKVAQELAVGAPHVDANVSSYVSRGGNYRAVPYNDRTWARGGVSATVTGYGYYGCRVALNLPTGAQEPVTSESAASVETRGFFEALSAAGQLLWSKLGSLIMIR